MESNINNEVIENFNFIGHQAYKVEEREMNQTVSFGNEYSNAPAYELLRLIDENQELHDHFVECIKDFIGELCERDKPLPEKTPAAPYHVLEFLMNILQWEEIYDYVQSIYATAEFPILQRGLQAILQSFTDEWENEEEFNIEAYKRVVDTSWKKKYKGFD